MKLSFYCLISFFLTFPGILALFGLPDRFNESRFNGFIRLSLLFWLIATYGSTFVFAFMEKEQPAFASGGLFFLTFGVLFWLGRNDHFGDVEYPRMN